MNVYRQGDVLVMTAEVVDLGKMERVPNENGRTILQHGTATGHAHALISPGSELWRPEPGPEGALIGDRILRLKQDATLFHDEHDPIPLSAGDYVVRIQREFAPEALRNVAD